MKSSFLSLNWKDAGKGLLVAVITAFITTLSVGIDAGKLPTLHELRDCGLAALAAGAGYIVKNLLTNSDDKLLKSESKAVKA